MVVIAVFLVAVMSEDLDIVILNIFMLLPSSTEKVVGTATPKEPTTQCQAAWHFSTGDELMISWESLSSKWGLKFTLTNQTSPDSSVMW